MGTTKTDTAQFDPTSMGTFQGLQGGLGSLISGYMNNPFGNPFFQTQQQMGTRQAQNLGQTGTSDLTRNITAGGFGSQGSPFAAEMLQNQARANTGLQAGLGFLNPVQNALGMQQWAGNLGAAYRPLQTGMKESTQGLGTWLPQLAQMAMAGAAAIPTGGASMIGPMMSEGMHLGQGTQGYGGWSGMGSNSMFQPSSYSAPNQLQGGGGMPTPPPWFGGS